MAAGRFLKGTDVFYDSLSENRHAFETVLALDKNPFSLSNKKFIFQNHQGYIFHFFDTTFNEDDPPVYGYREGELKTQLVSGSFSSFLQESFDEELEGRKV